MNFDNLKSGAEVKIRRQTYEIVNCDLEADPASDKNPPIRMYKVAYLHNVKSKSLMPTDELKYYPDTGEYYLITDKSKLLRVDYLKIIQPKIKKIKINEREILLE